jgi:DNA polymerase III epsilon subunit-like protein
LDSSPKISEILPEIKEDWKDYVLVAHNAKSFDYKFIDKV